MLSSRTLPTQRGALNKLKNHNMEVFGSIHCFSCDFPALHQYYILYAASSTLPRTPTKITFKPINELETQEKRGGVESCAISTTYSLYLFIQFLCHKNPCIDWQISHQLALKTWTQGCCNTDVSFTSTVVFLVPFLVQFEHIYSCDGILSMWINKASSCGMVYSFCHPCWKHDVYN